MDNTRQSSCAVSVTDSQKCACKNPVLRLPLRCNVLQPLLWLVHIQSDPLLPAWFTLTHKALLSLVCKKTNRNLSLHLMPTIPPAGTHRLSASATGSRLEGEVPTHRKRSRSSRRWIRCRHILAAPSWHNTYYRYLRSDVTSSGTYQLGVPLHKDG